MVKGAPGAAAQSGYTKLLPLTSVLPINTGLSSATEHTMILILGSLGCR